MDLRTHTGVVVAVLAAAITRPPPSVVPVVHRGVGPPDPYAAVPYCVVYSGLADTDGPSGSPDADVDAEVQVTSIGDSEEQASWMADKVRAALLDGAVPAPPTGRAWQRPRRPILHVLTRPVERDDDAGPGAPLFHVATVYALPTTPA